MSDTDTDTETYTANTTALNEDEPLDRIVLFALDEATEKLEQGGELEPFTVILHGENLHIESHPGEDAVECFNSAMASVQQLAHILDAYVFVYDGYVNTDEGECDAIIVERAKPGEHPPHHGGAHCRPAGRQRQKAGGNAADGG